MAKAALALIPGMQGEPIRKDDRSVATRQPVDWHAIASLRGDMLKFARLQLGDPDFAEDMVQEAMEAALRAANSFQGQSTLKTWVFAILKRRIIDHFRTHRRTVAASSLVKDDDDWQEQVDALFAEGGQWASGARPGAWPDPEASMRSKQFWAAFEACLTVLPAKTARVFMMREFLGLESDEICGHLDLSTTNLHVILHRARLKLRDCLQVGWSEEDLDP